LSPTWNEFSLDASIFGEHPKLKDIKIKVKDDDWGNDDDSIGKAHFKIKDHDHSVESRVPVVLKDDENERGLVYINVDFHE
jgi:Ca2+-dependent lipid-binding protein